RSLLGVVPRREHPLGTGEVRERAAIEEALAEFLGAGLVVADEDGLEVSEVFRSGLIAFARGHIGVEIPQLDGGLEPGGERDVREALLRAPYDGVGAHEAGDPDRRMRLLDRNDPRINEAEMEML